MLDPVLAFQNAVRETLIGSPELLALVPAEHVRAAPVRPDRLPSVLFGEPRCEFLGVASGSQRVAHVFLTLHVWAQEDGQDTARQIAATVYQALEFGPSDTAELSVDEWHRPSVVWLRDPKPELALTHGAMALEAVVRWRV
ncbi:DUF3168 domain-containing protein [Alloyangia pacifica]|uniref:DUF3168 domain-containing protein n=1 Tax=Alloyangia pacifica TaxID=311180 RepID=UPI001CD3EA1F|nr:DUF3168 domain-containing protein [Alloyangia pacifica]MCA0996307.1 DUF3168 domain-containing protein [Alloyangia pacifica]